MMNEEGAIENYRQTLSELESNSKPMINCLTMLAEENRASAVQIAACIENQLKSVPNKRKLPILYVIDSICKNFPQSAYVQLFTQNIVSNFCKVFEVSDEKVRKSLHKLRMTWNATKIFPLTKLNAIDERVHEMDPNWPILHKISQQPTQQRQTLPQTSQQQQLQQSHSQQPQRNTRSNTINNNINNTNNNNNSNNNNNNNNSSSNKGVVNASVKRVNNNGHSNSRGGRNKRAKRNNQQQQNNSEPIQPPPQTVLVATPQAFATIDPAVIQATQDLPRVLPTTYLDPSITLGPSDHLLHQVPTATYINPGNLLIAPPPPPPPAPQSQLNEPQMTAADPILYTPFNTGPTQATQPKPQQLQQQQQQLLQQKEAKSPHLYILESLYGGKQCSNCSLRFDDNDKSYDHHLDWHFRQRVKSESMFARRKWYYPLDLWIQFREINDDEHQDNNNPDSNVNEMLIPINDHEVPTAPASKDDEKNICSVCHETFEKFWAEEEEEWRLRNARLYEDERVYHPLCLKDYVTT